MPESSSISGSEISTVNAVDVQIELVFRGYGFVYARFGVPYGLRFDRGDDSFLARAAR